MGTTMNAAHLRLLPLLLALFALFSTPVVEAARSAPVGTVYVMRHLPKGEGPDPGLTTEGTAQAAALAKLLRKTKIKAVFVTATRRAGDTALPLATKLRLTPTVYDPSKPDQLVAAAGAVRGDILIVGHSNTVPDLVERFSGVRPAPLGENDYGTVWKIKRKKTTTLTLGPRR